MAEIQEDDIVYDLYCGVGSIGIYLAEKAKKVLGIELVEEAIQDARMNAKINGMENCEYYAADMRMIFSTEFIQNSGAPNIIIVDPPRAGMHPDVVEQLSRSRAAKIIYVSCNPQTMSNDLKTLSNSYNIEKIQPVDMFPNTIHIEAITLLTLK
jgi:23S rRNA (uracil1939-C5)-methyltransferase